MTDPSTVTLTSVRRRDSHFSSTEVRTVARISCSARQNSPQVLMHLDGCSFDQSRPCKMDIPLIAANSSSRTERNRPRTKARQSSPHSGFNGGSARGRGWWRIRHGMFSSLPAQKSEARRVAANVASGRSKPSRGSALHRFHLEPPLGCGARRRSEMSRDLHQTRALNAGGGSRRRGLWPEPSLRRPRLSRRTWSRPK